MATQAALNVVVKLRDQISAGLKKMGGNWDKWGAVAIAAVVVVTQKLVQLGKQLVAIVDQQAEAAAAAQFFADRLGTTTETMSQFGFVAERSGVAVEGMNVGLQRMSRRIGEAAARGGEFEKFMAGIGLNAKELARQSLEEQFLAVAGAIEQADDQGQKMADTFRFFDTEGVGILQTLADDGVRGIREALAEAERFNATVSSDFAKSAVQFERAQLRMSTALGSLTDQIVENLLPSLTKGVNRLAEVFADEATVRFLEIIARIAGTTTTIVVETTSAAFDVMKWVAEAASRARGAADFGPGGASKQQRDQEAFLQRQRDMAEAVQFFGDQMEDAAQLGARVLQRDIAQLQVEFEKWARWLALVDELEIAGKMTKRELAAAYREMRTSIEELGPPMDEFLEVTLTHEEQVAAAIDRVVDKFMVDLPRALNTAMVSFSVTLARSWRESKKWSDRIRGVWETLIDNLVAMLIRLAIQAAITAIIMSIATGGGSGAINTIRSAIGGLGSGGGSDGPFMLRQPPPGPTQAPIDSGNLAGRAGSMNINVEATYLTGSRAEEYDLAEKIMATAAEMGLITGGAA